ncbi:hypothetical protein [Pseudonocardia acidicola]|uniref:Uncharacterized protein n=1 Tax=Pseudonocardia acidicola TaxID=2724939 RepID=A0ABX1S8B9_9PSEU|nr:hypothetical protein [Pseudonocardia acidicola]NMH97791.1 hypothetical protein [Pseudonocardia acidicola]
MSPSDDAPGPPPGGLTWRDTAAGVLVGIVVLLVVVDAVRPGLPVVPGPRGVAAIGLLAGTAAFWVGGRVETVGRIGAGLLGAVGIVALAFGLSAIVTGSLAALTVGVAAIVLMWAAATARHLRSGRARPTR